MNKEFTALETLEELKKFTLKGFKNNLDRLLITGACSIIEKELKRLEEHDNYVFGSEHLELPKVKKLDDGIFCFEESQDMVFMPKAKCEESKKKAEAFEILKKHFNKIGGVRGNPDSDNEYLISLLNLPPEEFDFLAKELEK